MRTLLLQDAEDLAAGNVRHLRDAVGVTKDDANLGWRETLLRELGDLLHDLSRRGLQPRRGRPPVRQRRLRDTLTAHTRTGTYSPGELGWPACGQQMATIGDSREQPNVGFAGPLRGRRAPLAVHATHGDWNLLRPLALAGRNDLRTRGCGQPASGTAVCCWKVTTMPAAENDTSTVRVGRSSCASVARQGSARRRAEAQGVVHLGLVPLSAD